MTIELLIARHGNTLLPGEPSRRVGARTDMPLVESEKGKAIGDYLLAEQFIPDRVFSSPLQRTYQTAQLALEQAGLDITIETDEIFREIDYGPDENKLETEVVHRLGKAVIQRWNEHAIPPEGWIVDPKQIEQSWLSFARQLEGAVDGSAVASAQSLKVLVVTSNGVARFSPVLYGEIEAFKQEYHIPHLKMGTGSLSSFKKSAGQDHWELLFWNKDPANA